MVRKLWRGKIDVLNNVRNYKSNTTLHMVDDCVSIIVRSWVLSLRRPSLEEMTLKVTEHHW